MVERLARDLPRSEGDDPRAVDRGAVDRSEPARTVLMVLYFYPPVGGISVSRSLRNVQYLPRSGWTPVVLTPRDAAHELMDASLLDLVPPGIETIRTRSVEAGHVRPWVIRGSAVLRPRLPRRVGKASPRSPDDGPAPAPFPSTASAEPGGALYRLHRLVFFPDDAIGWLPFALTAALRRYRAEPFDVVYSTASPITSHLVAGMLKRLTGVPWVAEFRDPWGGTALEEPLPWVHRRLRTKLERWILRSADRVVFLAPSTARMYRRRYPGAADFVTIPNGYDRSETSASSRPPEEPRRFRIVWTGTLHRPPEMTAFLGGVDALLTRRPELSEQLEIVFYGAVGPDCQEVADRFVAHGRLGRVVQFKGFVPRGVALQAVADADAALVLLPAGHGMGVYIPGKVFDYLGQSRQILAMVPRGDTWDLLEELDWGVLAEPEPAQVERAIERLLALPAPARPADPEGRYDRVVLAGRLADTLRAAMGTAPRPRRAPRRSDRQ